MKAAVEICLYMFIMAMLKSFLTPKLGRLITHNVKEAQKLKPIKKIRMKFSVWKFIYFTTDFIHGLLVLINQPWVLKPETYGQGPAILPQAFVSYYTKSFAFYITELVGILTEPATKDEWELACHHVFTLILLFLSFQPCFIRFGVVILFVHSWVDPILEFGKVLIYCNRAAIADSLFGFFGLTFAVSRLVIYPYFCVRPAFMFIVKKGLAWDGAVILACLCGLVVMHVIWMAYILLSLKRKLKKGELTDVRE
ncbi:hypothetical protein ENBRE01_0107 [Enteropsectra breve]|nr:hypothetical protein ENBRE01_0107 [Enteropsectra breve]